MDGGEIDINRAEYWLFLVFGVIIATVLVVDLGFTNRKAKTISTKSALRQSILWVIICVGFGIGIWVWDGQEASQEFFSAYLTEYALSVDNIFVMILILRYFSVEEKYYHKVLFWGILGALVMRGAFIFLGAFLIHKFHWILYIFGAFLLYTGVKMLVQKDDDNKDIDEASNPVLRTARKILRFSPDSPEGKFFLRREGRLFFTPLFLVVLLIESTDLLFAVDSIPAAFGISQKEFVIYTSNIFAVMGLRAMFFLLSGVIDRFYLLQKGLSIVLIFIGLKMLVEIWHLDLPTEYSLLVIVLVLTGSIVFSIIWPKGPSKPPTVPLKS